MMMPKPLVPVRNWTGRCGEVRWYEAFPAFWPVPWPRRAGPDDDSRQGSVVADWRFYCFGGAPVGPAVGLADCRLCRAGRLALAGADGQGAPARAVVAYRNHADPDGGVHQSEEHTSELQSRPHLVCRLLLEKKNNRETTQAVIANTK